MLQRLEVETVVPSLEARHAALQSDLVAERALDRELSAMSAEDIEVRQSMLADAEEQEYVPASFGLDLLTLTLTTAELAHREQLVGNPEKGIPGRRPELDRAEQHLLSYRETFDKYSGEEARIQAEIAELEERRRDKRTRADLVRLQADFDALQQVHGWKLQRFDPRQIRMVHFDDTFVECSLQPGSLDVVKVELSLVEASAKHAATPGTQVARYLLKHVGEELHAILTQEGPKDARVRLRSLLRWPFQEAMRPADPMSTFSFLRWSCSTSALVPVSFAISATRSQWPPCGTRSGLAPSSATARTTIRSSSSTSTCSPCRRNKVSVSSFLFRPLKFWSRPSQKTGPKGSARAFACTLARTSMRSHCPRLSTIDSKAALAVAPFLKPSPRLKRRQTGPSKAIRSPRTPVYFRVSHPSVLFAYVWDPPWIHVMMSLRLVTRTARHALSQEKAPFVPKRELRQRLHRAHPAAKSRESRRRGPSGPSLTTSVPPLSCSPR